MIHQKEHSIRIPRVLIRRKYDKKFISALFFYARIRSLYDSKLRSGEYTLKDVREFMNMNRTTFNRKVNRLIEYGLASELPMGKLRLTSFESACNDVVIVNNVKSVRIVNTVFCELDEVEVYLYLWLKLKSAEVAYAIDKERCRTIENSRPEIKIALRTIASATGLNKDHINKGMQHLKAKCLISIRYAEQGNYANGCAVYRLEKLPKEKQVVPNRAKNRKPLKPSKKTIPSQFNDVIKAFFQDEHKKDLMITFGYVSEYFRNRPIRHNMFNRILNDMMKTRRDQVFPDEVLRFVRYRTVNVEYYKHGEFISYSKRQYYFQDKPLSLEDVKNWNYECDEEREKREWTEMIVQEVEAQMKAMV